MKFILRILALFALATMAHGATYYVRTDGSNSNNGLTNSAGGAWLTVQHAANTVVAGDTVNIAAGTYNERVNYTTGGGSSGSPATFVGAGQTTILGGWKITSSVGYVSASQMKLTGSGVSQFEYLITCAGSNCTFSDFWLEGVYSDIEGFGGIATDYAVSTSNNTFTRINILNMNYSMIVLWGTNHVVQDCTIVGDAGWDMFRAFGSGHIFRRNDCTLSNILTNPTQHPDFLQAYWDDPFGSTNVVVDSNHFRGRGVVDDLQIGNFEDQSLAGQVTSWTISNNVFEKIDRTLNIYAPNFKIYNNTFYRCSPSSGFVIIFGIGSQGQANNTNIRNNLFVECGTSASDAQGWYAGDAITGPVFDYDLVVGTGAGTTKNNTAWTTGVGGVTGTFETHGINGSSPLFTNAALGDFRILDGSPVIGAGVDLSAVFTNDITGATRTAPWDMGAYKYTGTPPPSGGDGVVTGTTTVTTTLTLP